jgi:predicted transcriptional regulator
MAKLFSIKEKYSDKIYSREKRVEFRRQNVDVQKGECCLIYTSSPIKKITGYFIVKEKIRTSINKLWKLTSKIAGISYREFKEYFKECELGTAIIFNKIQKFSNALGLENLRKQTKFRPPQSYYNLNNQLITSVSNLFSQEQLERFILNQQ